MEILTHLGLGRHPLHPPQSEFPQMVVMLVWDRILSNKALLQIPSLPSRLQPSVIRPNDHLQAARRTEAYTSVAVGKYCLIPLPAPMRLSSPDRT